MRIVAALIILSYQMAATLPRREVVRQPVYR